MKIILTAFLALFLSASRASSAPQSAEFTPFAG
jgi:hypothetical protein